MKYPTTTSGRLAAISFVLIALATALPAAHAQKTDDSLYRDLGGLDVLTKVVDDTLVLALADARIKDTFKETDMKRLAKLITEQFCELSGGPCKYSGDPMKEVHQGLALNNMQFNALVEDLQAAMDKSNIPSRTQNKLLALLAPMQRTVVTK
jgi:hemoglobin